MLDKEAELGTEVSPETPVVVKGFELVELVGSEVEEVVYVMDDAPVDALWEAIGVSVIVVVCVLGKSVGVGDSVELGQSSVVTLVVFAISVLVMIGSVVDRIVLVTSMVDSIVVSPLLR